MRLETGTAAGGSFLPPRARLGGGTRLPERPSGQSLSKPPPCTTLTPGKGWLRLLLRREWRKGGCPQIWSHSLPRGKVEMRWGKP